MEQAELHSPQLVIIEVSIYPCFLNMKTEISIGGHVKKQNKRGKLYHKTIAAVFSASLFEVRDNGRPNSDVVANNIHQGKITCLNRPSQGLSRLHPITILSAFESGHDELGHRKRIQRPEHSGGSFL